MQFMDMADEELKKRMDGESAKLDQFHRDITLGNSDVHSWTVKFYPKHLANKKSALLHFRNHAFKIGGSVGVDTANKRSKRGSLQR